MELNNPQNPSNFTFEKIVDIIVRLAILFWLVGWCFAILKPFSLILIWAAVIAIAIYPLYSLFIRLFRNRKTLAAIVLTLLLVSALLIPSWLFTQTLFGEVSDLRELNSQGQLVIPPPGEETANWPAVT